MNKENRLEGYLNELIDKLDEISDKGIIASEKVENHLMGDNIEDGLDELLTFVESKLNDMEIEIDNVRDLIKTIRKEIS